MASSDDAARVYLDNRRMRRARHALEQTDPALLRTLDSDTLIVRYFFDRGVESLRKVGEGAK